MTTPFSPTILQAGDVLLYAPKGFFGRLIALKTWHDVGHCEIFLGDGESAASRDGVGANVYPLRTAELAHVLRPRVAWDRTTALAWFNRELRGQPYGWFDLAQFLGWGLDRRGIVCSPCVTLVLRAGGVPIFGDEPALKIAPFQFLLSELLERVWSAAPAAGASAAPASVPTQS